MPDCVLSSQNRFYTELESAYGEVPSITAADRIAAIRLQIRQQREERERRDKTGSRTYTGIAPGSRKQTSFSLEAYLLTRTSPSDAPAIGPLVQASLGAPPLTFAGGSAGAGSTTTQIVFSGPHGLVKGQAFGFGGELRFVETVVNSTTAAVNAPFSTAPTSGNTLTGAVTYFPADVLPSVSVFDYWDPSTVVQRVLHGASCDRMEVRVNADFHEIAFSGEAQDVIDSVSFSSGQGGLGSFPTEPAVSGSTAMPVPGNLGQAWLGSPSTKFLTVTSAQVAVSNDIDLRNREFGTSTPQCIAPGPRRVTANFELFEVDDAATRGLYAAARSETPIPLMFQLGEAPGQMTGVYLGAAVPQVPEFDDSERVLGWSFENARAQGTANDEIVVAFG